MAQRYDDTGQRLTDCCGAYSTFMEGDTTADGSEYRTVLTTAESSK